MNFEEAVKEHKKGNDVYRETRSHLFWAEGDSILRFTMIAFPDEYVYFNLIDITATDWAIVEEKEDSLEAKLIGEFSSKVWAEEFVKMVRKKPEIATDEGAMICWFANAIMAGYDTHKDNMICVEEKEDGIEAIKSGYSHNNIGTITKPFNLSEMCKHGIVIDRACYIEEDIQEFITEIKEMIGKEMSSPTLIQIEIDKLSGSRFK